MAERGELTAERLTLSYRERKFGTETKGQGQPCDEVWFRSHARRQNMELEEGQRRLRRTKCVSAWCGTAGGFSLVEVGWRGRRSQQQPAIGPGGSLEPQSRGAIPVGEQHN